MGGQMRAIAGASVQLWMVRVLCEPMWMVLMVLVNIFCRREAVGVVGECECVQVWVYVWWCLCLGIALAWGHHTNLFPSPSPHHLHTKLILLTTAHGFTPALPHNAIMQELIGCICSYSPSLIATCIYFYYSLTL